MFRKFLSVLFFITIAALQTALSPRIAIFGVKPDLLLIAVVVWGMSRGPREGAFVGFGAGFLEDVLSANFYIHTLTKAIAGFLSGAIQRNFGTASVSSYAIIVGVLTPVSYLFEIMSFYFFFGRQLPGIYSIISVVFLSAVYNGLLTLLLFAPIVRASAVLSQDDRSSLKEYKLYRI